MRRRSAQARWYQVRIPEGDGAALRVPIAARTRSLSTALITLDRLRREGHSRDRLGVFAPTKREGSDGRWLLMPGVLA